MQLADAIFANLQYIFAAFFTVRFSKNEKNHINHAQLTIGMMLPANQKSFFSLIKVTSLN